MEFTKSLSILCIALFGLLGVFLLISRRKRSESNWILGIFFLLWSLNFLDGLLLLSGFYMLHPSLALLEDPLVFLYGPLIYFYVRSLTSGKLRWNPKHLLHLIPFCLLQAIILHFYHFQPTEHKLEIVGAILNLNQPPEVFMLMVLVFLHIFLYLGACQRLIKKYNRQIEHIYSTINLSWIKNTLRSLTFILILSLLVSVMQFMGNPLLFNISLVVLMVTLALFIGGVLFRAFEEPQLFVRLSDTKYASSRLTDNQKVAIENRIKQVLAQGKIYLNPDTTITDLADALDLSARQVSQVINQQFNQSFFELINSYRIKEAQTIIKNSKDPKMTILEVMYKVGFNSKSSFNTQFKKIIGLTPSEFKRLHQ